jgi:hypothetical protein
LIALSKFKNPSAIFVSSAQSEKGSDIGENHDDDATLNLLEKAEQLFSAHSREDPVTPSSPMSRVDSGSSITQSKFDQIMAKYENMSTRMNIKQGFITSTIEANPSWNQLHLVMTPAVIPLQGSTNCIHPKFNFLLLPKNMDSAKTYHHPKAICESGPKSSIHQRCWNFCFSHHLPSLTRRFPCAFVK